jgi:hypothetical protein
MPAVQVTAISSGFGGLLWNERPHRKAELLGVTVDNGHTLAETIQVYDGFATTSGIFMSGGAAQASEDLGVAHVLSGKMRLQMTVPAGETQKLGKEDLAGTEFIGKATVIGSADSANCIVIVQYGFKKE